MANNMLDTLVARLRGQNPALLNAGAAPQQAPMPQQAPAQAPMQQAPAQAGPTTVDNMGDAYRKFIDYRTNGGNLQYVDWFKAGQPSQ